MQNQPLALYAAASVKFPALSVAGLDNFPTMEATKLVLCAVVMDRQNVRDVMALAKNNAADFAVTKLRKTIVVKWTLPQMSLNALLKRL